LEKKNPYGYAGTAGAVIGWSTAYTNLTYKITLVLYANNTLD
jgi:hypothetical protein